MNMSSNNSLLDKLYSHFISKDVLEYTLAIVIEFFGHPKNFN